jgi:hypothetical protein
MKQFLFFILALSVAYTFSSCKKDDADDSFFKCKINEAPYEVEGILAYAVDFSGSYTIYGVKDNSGTESCYINIPKTATTGTHAFDGTDYYALYSDAAGVGFSTRLGSGNGSVTIEEIDAKHVKGTFQFTAYDSNTETLKKTVTDGRFDVFFR